MNKLAPVLGLLIFGLIVACLATGTDPRPNNSTGLLGPYENAYAVTTSDSTEQPTYTSALYIGVSGDVKVTTVKGSTVTFKAVPVGVLHVRVKLIFATGTTATNILGLY